MRQGTNLVGNWQKKDRPERWHSLEMPSIYSIVELCHLIYIFTKATQLATAFLITTQLHHLVSPAPGMYVVTRPYSMPSCLNSEACKLPINTNYHISEILLYICGISMNHRLGHPVTLAHTAGTAAGWMCFHPCFKHLYILLDSRDMQYFSSLKTYMPKCLVLLEQVVRVHPTWCVHAL